MHKKTLPILFATLLLDMIGIGMVIPIIPIIFTDPSSPSFLLQGYSVSMQFFIAGLVTALFGVMQFIAAPLLGELSDIYGRKRLLTVGVAVLAVSQLVFGFGIETGSIALILFARAVAGLAGANFSIAQAAIADVSTPENRAKNFGLIGAAFGIGFILGPLLGGYIAGALGNPAAPFWCAAALGVVNTLSISLFFKETRPQKAEAARTFHIWKGISNIRAALKDKDARPVYMANFLYMSGFSFFTSFIGVLLVNQFAQDETGIGTYFGVIGLWIVITQLFILRVLTKRLRERQILRYSIPLVAFAIALYPFMPVVALAYALIPFVAVPQGLTMANMTALVSKSVSPDKQGAALGINGSLLALSQGIIPLVAGLASGLVGIFIPFFAAGLFMLTAWLVLFVARRKAA